MADGLKEDLAPLGLDQHEPELFYGVWQRPERRLTHLPLEVEGEVSSWVLACINEVVAQAYVGVDAAQNERTRADYEVRPITLIEAFEEARRIPVPIIHSTGAVYNKIGGVAVLTLFRGQFSVSDLFRV